MEVRHAVQSVFCRSLAARSAARPAASLLVPIWRQQRQLSTSPAFCAASPTSAADKLRQGLKLPPRPPPLPRQQPAPATPASQTSTETAAATSGAAKDDAFSLPDLIQSDADKTMEFWNANEFLARHGVAKEEELRLRPSTGRTVHVSGHVDVARSFTLLERVVRQNKVRNDLFRQRFHERPGLKRKRLKSERWVRRFKDGFRATVSRVMELRKQGW
ncbi:hypothetical protein QBC46DRAFT_385739 [Diplogelasinospora grovesii]|uniref:Ribosomal protein S21 n=1 Tax=Diplogelasinospora grovesii TaxID=303347 RepID=A0AAN6N7J0_9PEZI|nr:hypothetical protein QBC46DRAFT_385739 [Diplogelasinospora grovesii]